jgi:4-amino-4-deoxy-L-arabinose transferase-like glycosyltransferase
MNAEMRSLSAKTKPAAAALLLVAAGVLSFSAALTESFTTDEPAHLTAGASYLATGDLRLNPEHPVLAKVWAALPLRLTGRLPFPMELDGWPTGDVKLASIDWLETKSDGNRLLRAPRAMMVLLLVTLVGAIGVTAWRLLGPEAGLLATALAAFEPLLLAHGHLVTTDAPVTLFVLLALLAFARFLERHSALRFALLAASLATAALVKYSWVLVVPALVLMATTSFFLRRNETPERRYPWLPLAALPFIVAVAIWAAYGFRFDPFRPGGPPAPTDGSWRIPLSAGVPLSFSPVSHDDAWESVLHDNDGKPRSGLSVAAVSVARKLHLLPEAYLYGFTFATRHAEKRLAYLHGGFSDTGWRSYFLVAYLVKTPLPELLLLAGGVAALVTRRARMRGDPVLAVGLFSYAVLYALVAVLTNLNIGLRHILPVYPALLVVASASAAWAVSRAGRIAVLLAAAWMAATALFSFPYYLGYFNEAVGGWRNGHRWLVDSNLDWNQDQLRLRDYQAAHPDERIVLLALYDTPMPPGLSVDFFVPRRAGQPWPSELRAGTYVISATWLVGTYQLYSRNETWERPSVRERYGRLWEQWSQERAPPRSDGAELWNSWVSFDGLRRGLLLGRLRARAPNSRIGTSFFAYRLSDRELEELTRPP